MIAFSCGHGTRLRRQLRVLAAAIVAANACAFGRTTVVAAPPAVFAPGVISDSNEQWRLTFTLDGKTAYFAESPGFFPLTRKASIYMSRLTPQGWSEPVLAPFSAQYSNMDPFISPDGRRLYFSSIRPLNGVLRGDIDLWY